MTTAIIFSAKMTLTRAQYSVLRKSHLLCKLKDSRVFHSNSVLVESWKIKIPEFRRDRQVFPSAGQTLNIVGFSERLVEDLMLYRTEEGELKGGLSLFNICFRLTQLPDHCCDRLKTYKTAMVTTHRPGKEWKGIWRTGLVSGNLTVFRICWKATFYMLFFFYFTISTVLQTDHTPGKYFLFGQRFNCKSRRGSPLLSCRNDREQKNIDLLVLHSPEW